VDASSFFLLNCYVAPQDPPSFPTRRSSDLSSTCLATNSLRSTIAPYSRSAACGVMLTAHSRSRTRVRSVPTGADLTRVRDRLWRSEEHTSELQSLTNLVCRLLLEKKKSTTL